MFRLTNYVTLCRSSTPTPVRVRCSTSSYRSSNPRPDAVPPPTDGSLSVRKEAVSIHASLSRVFSPLEVPPKPTPVTALLHLFWCFRTFIRRKFPPLPLTTDTLFFSNTVQCCVTAGRQLYNVRLQKTPLDLLHSFIYDSTSRCYNLSFTMNSDPLLSCLGAVL
jgi:hypothetical protein